MGVCSPSSCAGVTPSKGLCFGAMFGLLSLDTAALGCCDHSDHLKFSARFLLWCFDSAAVAEDVTAAEVVVGDAVVFAKAFAAFSPSSTELTEAAVLMEDDPDAAIAI